jgi:phosphoribosylformylglycinamidine synthase
MKWGVIRFPGSLDDGDALYALRDVMGQDAIALWHKDESIRGAECIVLPGGFSYGDHLRCGAIARFSPIMGAVTAFADHGGLVLGICNGFQILTESGLLPGVLRANESLSFVCRDVRVRVEDAGSAFTSRCAEDQELTIPVKHGEGCWFAGEDLLAELEANGQILLRYAAGENPNGAVDDVAGVRNAAGNVFGLMPHPEHAVDPLLGSADGALILGSLVDGARLSSAALV